MWPRLVRDLHQMEDLRELMDEIPTPAEWDPDLLRIFHLKHTDALIEPIHNKLQTVWVVDGKWVTPPNVISIMSKVVESLIPIRRQYLYMSKSLFRNDDNHGIREISLTALRPREIPRLMQTILYKKFLQYLCANNFSITRTTQSPVLSAKHGLCDVQKDCFDSEIWSQATCKDSHMVISQLWALIQSIMQECDTSNGKTAKKRKHPERLKRYHSGHCTDVNNPHVTHNGDDKSGWGYKTHNPEDLFISFAKCSICGLDRKIMSQH